MDLAPALVHRVIDSAGEPLDSVTETYFGVRFAHDFSAVRIHNDSAAATSADAVGARAYTMGSHIAFAAGRYAPHSAAGRELLTHELAHVVQQSKSVLGRLAVDPHDSAGEREAAYAQTVGGATPISIRSYAPVVLARFPESRNLSAMSDDELRLEYDRVGGWLTSSGTPDLDFKPSLEYYQRIEEEVRRRDPKTPPSASTKSAIVPDGLARPPALAVTSRPAAVGSNVPANPRSPVEIPPEGVDMPWVGSGVPSSELGYARDHEYFWSQFDASYPGRLSPANLTRLSNRRAPVVDAQWLQHFPEHAGYLGDILEHHHVGQGSRAVPLPESLHDAYTVFHPQRRVVGTPARGAKPIPPMPPANRTSMEIDRHTRDERIVGPGITPGSPPVAPTVPPASEVAGRATRPRRGSATANVARGAAVTTVMQFAATVLAEWIQEQVDQSRFESEMRRLEPEIVSAISTRSSDVADVQIDSPGQPGYAVVTVVADYVTTVMRSLEGGGYMKTEHTGLHSVRLAGVAIDRTSQTASSSSKETAWPFPNVGSVTHVSITYSIPLLGLDNATLADRVKDRLNDLDAGAETTLTEKGAAEAAGNQARLTRRLADLRGNP